MDNKIQYRAGYKYQLHRPHVATIGISPDDHIANDYIVLSKDGILIINAGYAWDGPSGPTFDTANFMRGSLVHDALYQLMREGLLDQKWREQADLELQRMCIEDGMSAIRAWWVFKAVRWAGGKSARWQKEAIFTAP